MPNPPIRTTTITPVVYLKDEDGLYVLDTNDNKIVLKTYNEILSTDDYEFIIEHT